MDWLDRHWDSLHHLINHLELTTGLAAIETPTHLSELAEKVRLQFPEESRSLLKQIPLVILPVAELDAYGIPTSQGPIVAIDYLMATVLPAFTLITWGMSFEDPSEPEIFDPRQLIWLTCSVHMRDIRPTLCFPCWSIVFDALHGKRPDFAPALKMVDVELAWVLAHEYGHIVRNHLATAPSPEREYEADRIATEVTWNVFRPFEHFVWALESIFLLFAILERFEPIDEVHPPASQRAEAIRQQLLQLPDGGMLWQSVMKRTRELSKMMVTSFDLDAACQHWRNASAVDVNWWRV